MKLKFNRNSIYSCFLSAGIQFFTGLVGFVIIACGVRPIAQYDQNTLHEAVYVDNVKNEYTIHLSNISSDSTVILVKASNSSRFTKLSQGKDTAFNFTNKEARPYFKVISGKDSSLVSNRHFDFDKVVNFRDIGGLKTTDGRVIKWGMIYRSDNLSKLRDSEFEKFKNLRIRTVYDLRTDHEITGKEDHLPVGTNYVHSPTVKDNEGQIAQLRSRVIGGEISEKEAKEQTVGFYRDAVSVNLGALRDIIKLVIDSDEPVLYHCSAGKDRTGIISALILSILRVDRKTIMEEYLMSNYYRRIKTEKLLRRAKLGKLIKRKMDLKAIEVFMTVDASYLNAVFDLIDNKYGGMDEFIKNQLQIDPEFRKRTISSLTFK